MTDDNTRRPYNGSCHCGQIKYILWATFPPPQQQARIPAPNTVRAYKCNCTLCHKASIFHIRLPSAPDDFVLVTPLDIKELGDYRCNGGSIRWLFCKNCGVRCFSFDGQGETSTRADIPGKEGEEVQVWRPKKDGWGEYRKHAGLSGPYSYLSVNAHTIEPKQDGFDLREWVEQKRVVYLDGLEHEVEETTNKPAPGGTY